MEREPVFKYQKQIDELLALGCQLPELFHNGKVNTSLLALSCFATTEKAETFYANLRKAFKNVDISKDYEKG